MMMLGKKIISQIPDHQYKMLVTAVSGSGKTNALFNPITR